ncbi:MAG: radical SAM protein [Nitrososphaerota archaeon]
MRYDVVFLHPPAVFDFRERPYFPGPIAYTVSEGTHQFIIPPIGMLSVAEYLERRGYKVYVDNIGERMIQDKSFNVVKYLEKIETEIFGIDLHWIVHAHGAINLARICKQLHPDSIIVLGGLTASIFHEEIIRKYRFVDVVVRGEAEKPFLKLVESLEKYHEVRECPNTTYRVGEKIRAESMMEPSQDLDEFEFTRLDLLKPKTFLFSENKPPYCAFWSLPICRGCVYNCATCGGSAYTYKTYLARNRPAFRSPEKIVEDLDKLHEQGVKTVFLFQDPRMGGRRYWEELFKVLKNEGVAVDHVTLELFEPAPEEYIKTISKIGVSTTLTISTESGSEKVRKLHGRNYTNRALIETIKTCQKYGIPILVFFMVALAYENDETIKEMWKLWEEICIMDKEVRGSREGLTAGYGFGQMIFMDPGSPSFDSPSNFGYKLIHKTLEEHVNAMSLPSWHQWINYETCYLDRRSIVRLILDSLEYSINLREKFGIYSRVEAFRERTCFVNASRIIVEQVDQIMNVVDEEERNRKLQTLHNTILNYIKIFS